MRKSVNYFLLIFCVLISLPSYSQRAGYVVLDTLYTQGYLNFGAENLNVDSVGFSKRWGTDFTYYNANELKEYGLNGKSFRSVRYNNHHIFVRQLVTGSANLYLTKKDSRKVFFLDKEEQLLELEKKNYRHQLKLTLEDNHDIDDLVTLISFRKNALTRLVRYYNEDSPGFFPYKRFGIIAGYSNRTIKFAYRGFTPKLGNKPTLMIGAFIELPIDVSTRLSTRFELTYISNKYFLHTENVYVEREYNVHVTTINLPLLVRYRGYGSSFMPVFDFGFVLGYNFKNEINLLEISNDPKTPGINEFSLAIIDKVDFGMAAGAGLDYQLNHKNTIGIELRYQFNFGLEGSIDHTISDLQVLASFNF